MVAEEMPDGRKHVAIFLSVFDVHVNRAPTACVVASVVHQAGQYFHAGSLKAERDNARVDVVAECPHGVVSWRQLSGAVARKISCRLAVGVTLQTGQRFGLIYFGSRMDVYLPAATELQVTVGTRVLAGESVIALFKGNHV